MGNRLTKSKQRIMEQGEVFTPKKTVNCMLDKSEIKTMINSLTTTFLEPSAGEGAFLVELLKRKLRYAKSKYSDKKDLQNKFLQALSTLYGIELMEDNVKILVMNMVITFRDMYLKTFGQEEQKSNVLESAKVIISANMIQGDALTRKTATGSPIIFSEWEPINKNIVQRREYTFDDIVESKCSTGKIEKYYEQLNLLVNFENKPDELNTKKYIPVQWPDIYQQLKEA